MTTMPKIIIGGYILSVVPVASTDDSLDTPEGRDRRREEELETMRGVQQEPAQAPGPLAPLAEEE